MATISEAPRSWQDALCVIAGARRDAKRRSGNDKLRSTKELPVHAPSSPSEVKN
jgi:hypothetical protein